MIALVVGVLLGAALATPLIPLLRVTELPVGRAAAGIAVIGAAVFAIQFWLIVDEADDLPFKGIANAAAQVALNVWPIYGVAALVAVIGLLAGARHSD